MKNGFVLLLFTFVFIAAKAQGIQAELAAMDTAFSKGNYREASLLADKIYAKAISEIKNDTVLVEYLSTAGSSYYQLEEYAKAGKYFREAADQAKTRLGEMEYHYSLALFNLASCLKEEGRYAEAEPLYLQSLPVLATAFGQSSLQYTRCFYTLASMYVDMARYAEAESMCAAAVNFYKTILGETSPDYLGALGTMAVIYQGQAKYEQAEAIFLVLKNYHAAQSIPDQSVLQTLENNLGELYRHMGDYARAEPALENAVRLAGSNPSAAYSLNNLALVQKALGKYNEAEKAYRKALQIYVSQGKREHPDYTNPLNNLGELYRTMGRLQDAVYAFEEVISIRKKTLGTQHANYANALNNLALVEFAIGKYPDAEKHLEECLAIYKITLGEKDKFYANCLNNLASVYKANGSLLKAEATYQSCIRIYKATYGETSDKYGIYLGGLAGTYRQMKRYPEAIALTQQSLAILRNKLGEYHYDHIETEYNLAETYREAGQPAEAEKHYHNAIKGYLLLIEKYFPYLSEKDKTLFYFNVANAFETFNSFVLAQWTKNPSGNHSALINQMYNNRMVLKSLLLKESGKMKEAVAFSRDTSVINDYQQWLAMREQIIRQYRMSEEDRSEKKLNLPQLELNANQLEQKITIALGLAKKNNAGLTDWTRIRAALKPGEYAVEIIRTEEYTDGKWTDKIHYAALILDHQSTAPRLVLLKPGKELETKAISYYRLNLKGRREDLQSYNEFWEPLKKYMPAAKKIYFSADGVYQQINLYTLLNPATRIYLIDELAVSMLTNTRDLLEPLTENKTYQAAIFSFPDFGGIPVSPDSLVSRTGFPVLDELPGTKEETDSVMTILKAAHWTVEEKIRKTATEEAIKKIKRPQVLHIATHGFFLKDVKDTLGTVYGIQADIARQHPLLRSGVILAGAAAVARNPNDFIDQDDGILTAYEAADLDLTGTGLVVLSACETGLGELLNGQGVYGLQRAFLQAGAASVIMSLWKVNDESTKELMIGFYREWLLHPEGNKQEALRKAQRQLREQYAHPFFWGPFVMVGK
ncbi:MAG: CHAT domain-containing protein [Chitinophagaceae bacterium]|nr:CHAT domain-containing protein [Chitinophagaceae bacterium]